MTDRPNILLLISDQERQRSWIPEGVALPWRQRLLDEGMEFTNYWTHSAPCSPSRATIMVGQYLAQHGVVDNVIWPWHAELDPARPTIGSCLGSQGYRSSYIGKWHLSLGATPPMEAYGYSDWDGNDLHYMGWAGTGEHFDPLIADDAALWLDRNANQAEPWFLTVALVNPHDVMWFPIDQPGYREQHPDEVKFVRDLLELSKWKDDDPLPIFPHAYDEVVESLPANFGDDLITKPATQRQWRWDQQHGMWGYIPPDDERQWRRALDYYVKLHQLGDDSLGTVLSALDRSGRWDDTVILYTSDHGDMCGSHGLRSKGPFVYDEIMRIPLYVKGPGIAAGSVTDSLGSHVDIARTICGLAGVTPSEEFLGVDLGPVLADPTSTARDHVMFAHDTSHTLNVLGTRYTIRGFFDGRHKYARYYGIGGGLPSDLSVQEKGTKLYDVDARFEDQEHEWYDLHEDPHEMENLAMDRGRGAELREKYEQLLALEAVEFA